MMRTHFARITVVFILLVWGNTTGQREDTNETMTSVEVSTEPPEAIVDHGNHTDTVGNENDEELVSVAPTLAPSPSKPSCYSNGTELALALLDKDPFTPETFVICPGSVIRPGSTIGDGRVFCCSDGESPLMPRSNSDIRCGEDGKSSNNCTIVGGPFQLLTALPIYFEEGVNMEIRGITFSKADVTSVLLSNGGNLIFRDCIFQDHVTKPIHALHNLELLVRQRVLEGKEGEQTMSSSDDVSTSDDHRISQNIRAISERYNSDRESTGKRRSLQVSAMRETVTFDTCIFQRNGKENNLDILGLITVENGSSDLIFKECSFRDNIYGVEGRLIGHLVQLKTAGSTISLTGNCFLDNKIIGGAAIAVPNRDSLIVAENNFVRAAGSGAHACSFLQFNDGECIAADQSMCVSFPEPPPTSYGPTTEGDGTRAPSSKGKAPSEVILLDLALGCIIMVHFGILL